MPHNTDPANALLGSLEWRGQALALWDLRMTLDSQGSQQSADARVIVLQSGAQTVALLVEAVVALVPGHAGTRSRFSTNGRPVEMVTVGSGGQQVSYQLMDLSQLACFAPA